MEYIESPTSYRGNKKSLFLAGGITDCPPWQNDLVSLLGDLDLTILNPRRSYFEINNLNLKREQIEWEHAHLKKADMISFWFPKEALCITTLYELGYWLGQEKKIFLGIDPEYEKRYDVEIQTLMVDSNLKIEYSLEGLAAQINHWTLNNL